MINYSQTFGKAIGVLIVASACVIAISDCKAQMTMDISKLTCEQFVVMRVANPHYVAIWLNGYYNGKRGNTVIDVEQFKDNMKTVKRYCLYNNKGTVMEAVETLMKPAR